MNWEAVSGAADLLAAVAVLVTLVYVAVQVRQAKDQLELSAQRHRADAAREVMLSVSESPELVAALHQLGGFNWGDFGLADPQDTVRVASWCHAWMRTEELNFRMNSSVQRKTQEELLKMWLSVPWAAKFWIDNRSIYDVDFAARMDALLKGVSGAGNST
jgi:hypothetical protein